MIFWSQKPGQGVLVDLVIKGRLGGQYSIQIALRKC